MEIDETYKGKKPLEITDPMFDDDSVGWCDDPTALFNIHSGVVIVPHQPNMIYVSVIMNTNLTLIQSSDPRGDWLRYKEYYDAYYADAPDSVYMKAYKKFHGRPNNIQRVRAFIEGWIYNRQKQYEENKHK